MLKPSVETWNAMRRSDPDYVPDLSAVDLEEHDLSGADLQHADLRGAYLNGAKFVRANLRRADLRRAHLTYADLSEANLEGADLRAADLHGADLRGAKLDRARVEDTILDPLCWTKPLLMLWEQASPENRERLVVALKNKTVLHRKWMEGPPVSPEAILSKGGAVTDDFTFAWDTYGISEERVLSVLKAAS